MNHQVTTNVSSRECVGEHSKVKTAKNVTVSWPLCLRWSQDQCTEDAGNDMYTWEDTHSITKELLCPDAGGDDFGWGVGKLDGCMLPLQCVDAGKLPPRTFGKAA
jgi:hypothetical protein